MRYPAILAVVMALFPVACNTDGSAPVGDALDVPLLTEDAMVVGNVNVANSETTLMVTLTTSGEWTLKDIRWAVGTELRHIPQTRNGAPITGRFPIRRKPGADATLETWRLPLIVEPGTVLYFAVNADVKMKASKKNKASDPGHDGDDENCTVDSAWGEGSEFPARNGSMYFTYTVQRSQPPSLAGLYRTQTQEEWGGDPAVDRPADYLAVNFGSAFPLGVTVGTASGFTARFTSAEAVAAFLPQSGPSGSLGRNWQNPVTMGNSLAGNTLALAITVGFDVQFGEFSPGILLLQDLVVADPSSPFLGYAVREVLALANQVLSGQEDARFTADQINEGVLKINMTFQNGTVDLGFLSLP